MSKSINLVSTKNSFLESEQRILNILRAVAVSLLITVALVSILTFIIGATIPLTSLKQQENSTVAAIAQLHKKLAVFELTKDRVGNIRAALAQRKDLTKPIDEIVALSGSVRMDSISVEKEGIRISVSSDSLTSINSFIDNFYNLGNKKTVVKDVNIESLNLNAKTDIYFLSMSAKTL